MPAGFRSADKEMRKLQWRKSRGRAGKCICQNPQQALKVIWDILINQVRISLCRKTVIQHYRESLKGSSQVVRIYGGKIVFACLQLVNKTQLSHLISHNLGRAF